MSDESPNHTEPHGGANLPQYSVSEISRLLKRTVEDAFPYVRVRGELSRINRHASGHCYFDLKDDKAVIAAVVWKGSYARLAMTPEQGLEVVCTGRLTTYPGQSKYQIVVEQMELAGIGALMAMLEERRKKLAAEGLFDEERKKAIPFLPETIGVITSPTGAVIRDIMHRLADRFPRRVILWPVTVQGKRAPDEIAAAIRGFNALKTGGPVARPDVLIVARGGGSFEDLLAFSDEAVVRAAAESEIPLISAIGHETDTTLIDFAADRRAPTPTAAAEMVVPVRRELVANILELEQRLLRASMRGSEQRRQIVIGLARALPRADILFALPRQRFDAAAERLRGALFANLQRHRTVLAQAGAGLRLPMVTAEIRRGRDKALELESRLRHGYENRLAGAAQRLSTCTRMLGSVSYRAVLARGFTLVRGEGGALHRRAAGIRAGEHLALTFADGEARVVAEDGTAPKRPRPKSAGKGRKITQGDLF